MGLGLLFAGEKGVECLFDLIRITWCQIQCNVQDDPVFKVEPAVGKNQVLFFQGLNGQGFQSQNVQAVNPLSDPLAGGTGIHDHGASHGSGDTGAEFQAGQVMADRIIADCGKPFSRFHENTDLPPEWGLSGSRI